MSDMATELSGSMSYEAALKVGHGNLRHAKGDVALAATAKTLSEAHGGLNPKMVYEGAKSLGVTDAQLRKMSPMQVGDLMFVDPTAAKAKPPKLDRSARVDDLAKSVKAGAKRLSPDD